MRALVIVLCAFCLSACNMVYSEKPLFTAADAKGAAKLKPGVWVRPKPDCVLTPDADPLPECANAVTVSSEAFLPPPGVKPPEGEIAALPYIMTGKDPAVVQIDYNPPKEGGRRWLYFALKPTKTDGKGRAVEGRIWFVQCGPPPPKGGSKYVTNAPLPGLKVQENDCIAETGDAVRGAAKASEAWDEEKESIRWLRDR